MNAPQLFPYWWTPEHMPATGPVKFLLQPLSLSGQYQIAVTRNANGTPGEDALPVIVRHIKGWEGLTDADGSLLAYSPATCRGLLERTARGGDYLTFLCEIAGHLFPESFLSENDRKK